MSRNLSTHFNPYPASVAIWQQSLENLKNIFLTMFYGFQKLLHTLRLLKLSVYLQHKIIVPIISSFISSTNRNLKLKHAVARVDK